MISVLFLCTGNSARSILAEAILNRSSDRRFRAHSAGSFPKREVHPAALKLLKSRGYTVDQLRSKSWDEFTGHNAPDIDIVLTVCDNAASEVCPMWPGRPVTAHWGVPAPALATGPDSEIAEAFSKTYGLLKARIAALTDLPVETMAADLLQKNLNQIKQTHFSD